MVAIMPFELVKVKFDPESFDERISAVCLKTLAMLEAEVTSWLDTDGGFIHDGAPAVGLFITAPTTPNPTLASDFGLPVSPNYPPQEAPHLSAPALPARWTIHGHLEWFRVDGRHR